MFSQAASPMVLKEPLTSHQWIQVSLNGWTIALFPNKLALPMCQARSGVILQQAVI